MRGNKPTDPEWAKTLKPGWQRYRRKNFNNLVIGVPVEEDLVSDKWTDIFSNSRHRGQKEPGGGLRGQMAMMMEIADYQKMNGVRARVDQIVGDPPLPRRSSPGTASCASVRPSTMTIYRPSIVPTLSSLIPRENGVERMTKTGIVVNGVEYKVDCLIFATGFEVGTA